MDQVIALPDRNSRAHVVAGPGKRYFYTLDAMRGVAAIGVVVLHLHGLFAPYGVPHGYLAVDFFFALSGLVISRAYAERFRRGLSVARFLGLRVERLYPLYILGTAMGIVVMVVPFHWHPELSPPTASLVVSGLAALIMAPSPLTFGSEPWLTPFNIAAWSLVLELVVNVLFALIWPWLSRRVLTAIIAGSGTTLVIATLRHGNLDLGAAWPTVAVGLVRTCFSFFVGVAIGAIRVKTVKVSPLALLLPFAVFLTLLVGLRYGAIYDLGCALFVYPALLFCGARVEAPWTGALRFLGNLSYPLYVIHGPLLYLVGGLAVKYASQSQATRLASGMAVVLVVAVIAVVADHLYDRPVRNWLAKRR